MLLEVKSLQTQFRTESGLVKAVNDVSYYAVNQCSWEVQEAKHHIRCYVNVEERVSVTAG